jgi:hypothetical protein
VEQQKAILRLVGFDGLVKNLTDRLIWCRLHFKGLLDDEEVDEYTEPFPLPPREERGYLFDRPEKRPKVWTLVVTLEVSYAGPGGLWTPAYEVDVWANPPVPIPPGRRPSPSVASADLVAVRLMALNLTDHVVIAYVLGEHEIDGERGVERADFPNMPPGVPYGVTVGDGKPHYSWTIRKAIYVQEPDQPPPQLPEETIVVEVRSKELAAPPPPGPPPEAPWLGYALSLVGGLSPVIAVGGAVAYSELTKARR